MRVGKYVSACMIMLAVLLVSTSVFAGFSDVSPDAGYRGALERLVSLEIMNGYEDGTFQPESSVTREQFAKVIVTAAGLQESANTLKGYTIFPDVDPQGWASGYINVALEKGYITGMIDSKFHPMESITFGQVCTIMVKALGYTDEDVSGLWPRNYVEKARSLGLVPDMNFSNNDPLPRWAVAVMIDKLLSTNIKTTNGTAAKTFADTSDAFVEGIVLGNYDSVDNLASNQIMTDKGVYYVKEAELNLELGEKYRFKIKDDTIVSAYSSMSTLQKVTVNSVIGTTIKYMEGTQVQNMILPDKTIYYYNGVQQKYEDLKNLLQANSSIVFSYNKTMTGFDYAVIFDPIFSSPEIATNEPILNNKLGRLTLSSGMPVLRNTNKRDTNPPVNKQGEQIDIMKIKENDVVYTVTDVWGNNGYILVIDNKIDGEITGFLPNKVSPQTIQVDSVDYALSKDMNLGKINNVAGAFKIEDEVTLLLGQDDQVVDVINSSGNNASHYAFVINYSSSVSKDINDFNATTYTVKMLLTDGSTETYKTETHPGAHYGNLVKYEKLDEDTVKLERVDYFTNREFTFDKLEDKIDSSYVANNIKIFNLKSNQKVGDTQVELVDWSSMPHGNIPAGKVLYTNTAGAFSDVNILLVKDIFDENYRLGVVTKSETSNGTSYNNTLQLKDEQYSFSTSVKIDIGTVMYVETQYNDIKSYGRRSAAAEGDRIEAVDATRIKVNGKTLRFNKNITIYFKDITGTVTAKGTGDIDLNRTYKKVSVYTDNLGKAEVVFITE